MSDHITITPIAGPVTVTAGGVELGQHEGAVRVEEAVDQLDHHFELQGALDQADACLRILGGDAAKKLGAALSDASKFGMAKSIVMAGSEAGFDMESKEGIEAWMRRLQSQPLPASIRLPSPGPEAPGGDKKAERAKKSARKAVRKARRKNR